MKTSSTALKTVVIVYNTDYSNTNERAQDPPASSMCTNGLARPADYFIFRRLRTSPY